jgi:hypothetical protein
MSTLVTILLAALPSIMTTIETLTEFFNKSIATLKQATELTPEQEATRNAIIAEAETKSYWQEYIPPDAS